MSGFSIVIITYNEEENIGRCIDSLKDLSDDLIIIDANSTDRTAEICKEKGIGVLNKNWDGYGSAKNYGAKQAKYDWIFSIDADEVCSSTLFDSLINATLDASSIVYSVKRSNYIKQRAIRFGHLHPEWKPRLFHKNQYRWDDKPVHELLTPKPQMITKLLGELSHYQAKSLSELELSYERYAILQSSNRYHKWYNLPQKYMSASDHFMRSYFLMLGFVEGAMGFRLAILRSKVAWVKYS